MNRLATASSPYLRQHASNPVDWYPWGPEALDRARVEGRPILLSVGYAACHWCHVMERESFSDPTIAAQMNRDFVCVKVDREERPDLDEVMMSAVQAFTGGHGGWPMTLFLTPGGRPYLGGTYFPPVDRRGMPGLPRLMEQARALWEDRRQDVEDLTERVVHLVAGAGALPEPAAGGLPDDWLAAAAAGAWERRDPEHGGLGGAPKFPPHGVLPALVAAVALDGDERARQVLTDTLDAMAGGGLVDLLGGGFARYSVDRGWVIPHFEKMLYDNAQLAVVYAEASALLDRPGWARVARETVDYMLRDLAVDGGLAASEDADSEGEEGRFYVWTPAQLREVLGPVDGNRAAELLRVTAAGSFEAGRSVLRIPGLIEGLPRWEADFLTQRALPALAEARAERVRPARDGKVLAAWNGLALSALARVGWVLDVPAYLDAARDLADGLLARLVVDGRLHRVWMEGRATVPALLEDHALLGLGLVDLHQATGEPRWLAAALDLADDTVARFWDPAAGGLFTTAHDAEAVLTRTKTWATGAVPGGNGAAALWFAHLAALAGREDLGERADRVLASVADLRHRAPSALGPALLAGAWRTGRVREVAVRAPSEHALVRPLRRVFPLTVRCVLPPGAPAGPIPWMEGKDADVPTAWVCEGGACRLPVHTAPEVPRIPDRRPQDVDALDRSAPPVERPRSSYPSRGPEGCDS